MVEMWGVTEFMARDIDAGICPRQALMRDYARRTIRAGFGAAVSASGIAETGVKMAFVIFWILCGIGASLIAKSRGASGAAGAVLGFFLGPIGVLCAFFMGGEQAKAARQIYNGAKKKCPRCAELVQPDAQVCKHCGFEFA